MSKEIKGKIISESKGDYLMKKWGKFLDSSKGGAKPVTDPWTRLCTAQLLEKQESLTLKESTNTAGPGGVFGSTQAGSAFSGDLYAPGDSRLPKVFIPMVRRTFPELIANEVVGVQPMSGPVGMAFGLRFRYEADPLGVTRGDNLTGYEAVNDTPVFRTATDGQEIGYQGLNTTFSGTSAAELSGGSEFAMIDSDKGVAQLLKDFEISSNVGQVVFDISKTTVYAGTRRLATKFSLEAEEDIRSVMGIDIDNELVNTMSYEVQAEIDREIVIRMIQTCINSGYGSGKGYSIWNAASADARWSAERGRDLYNRIIVESNRLAIKNRRGVANFIIATPSVCAILQNLREFLLNPVDSTVKTGVVGVAKVGVVAGQMTVYRDTRTEAQYLSGARGSRIEYALLGYKGAEFYDTGIVFCPYIPLMTQRTIGPNDMAPRIGLRTRYGVVSHIFGSDLFYHLLIVKGLGESFTPGTTSVYL